MPYIGDLADPHAPACALSDPASAVSDRLRGSPYDGSLVLDDHGIVLGWVPAGALETAEDGATAESLMRPGPSTVRANKTPAEIAKRMRKGDFETAIVTTPRGVLIGAVTRARVEQALSDEPERGAG